MAQTTFYKNIFEGGEFNGGERYYKKLSTAKAQATKYVNKQTKTLFDKHIYVNIYEIDTKKGYIKWIKTIQ